MIAGEHSSNIGRGYVVSCHACIDSNMDQNV